MANEIRILQTVTVDLSTNSPQTIDMSAYGRYVVTGFVFADLSGAAVSVDISNALLGHTASGVGYCAAKPSIGPLLSGNITATRSGATAPGASVTLHVIGTDVP